MAKRFGFTYLFCVDLEAMRDFYGGVLGLEQIWDDGRSLAYRIGDHQLSITQHDGVEPAPEGYAVQPGWDGGTEPRTSWSLECDPQDFSAVVASARAHGTPAYRPEPTWVGYWSYPLLDPMNNTIEVTCTVRELGTGTTGVS